jgi:DinB superfamily
MDTIHDGCWNIRMQSPREDLVETFDHVWQRFRRRVDGLDDEEWRWQPTPDDRLTLSWRLHHIADLLAEDRNAVWLGVDTEHPKRLVHSTARDALADIEAGYEHLASILTNATDTSLAERMGPAAGMYADATRFSFALHLLDEFVHHTAESALLRDLYPAARK